MKLLYFPIESAVLDMVKRITNPCKFDTKSMPVKNIEKVRKIIQKGNPKPRKTYKISEKNPDTESKCGKKTLNMTLEGQFSSSGPDTIASQDTMRG